ncbi:class I SAM-dependent methyltransferase [Actinokineospora iranica]|uniref:Methyltransferase domain-containing protein n=1 Tax=Actinokineospora iranica TaxID=1271860 RepID=A0A1G6SIV0_9PSEU|nr:class I SAM-dependent methyltransferase [Actinokineospora iranica]SDD16822.1 Methyltransferase domain-containing protein [Actinokineospora iranica]
MTNSLGALFDAGTTHFDALTDRLWGPVSASAVAVAQPVEGEHVFDACYGTGASALPTARAVGPTGRVDAIDLADKLLAVGRSRAEGLPWLTFHHGDVTTWSGGPYDLVQCVLGVFFLPDMDAGSRALISRLRPGGRFAATVWRKEAILPVPEILQNAVSPERAETPAAPVRRGASERVNTPELLTAWLTALGLRDARVVTAPHTLPLDPDVAWALVLGSALRGFLTGLDPAAVERTRVRFTQELLDRGVTAIDATTLVGVGTAV